MSVSGSIDIVIISRREALHVNDNYAGLVANLFDVFTYIMIGLSLGSVMLYLWLALRTSLSTAFIMIVGLAVGWQSIEQQQLSPHTRLLANLVSFQSFILFTSFSGSIVAQLLVETKPRNIDTLEDLEQQPHLKVNFIALILCYCQISNI